MPDDLRELRTVVANVNVALEFLEMRSDRYFERPDSPAMLGWLHRAETNLQLVLRETARRIAARTDLWGELPAGEDAHGNLEDASASLTALLDMFVEIDPGYALDASETGDEPLTLPEDEQLVREQAAAFARAVAAVRTS